MFIVIGFEVSYARFLFIQVRGRGEQFARGVEVGENSSDNETDVLFLFDVGFSAEKIALSKNISVELVEKIISQRGSQVREKKQTNLIRDVANQNPWKDGIPEHEVVMGVVRSIETDNIDLESYGARTIPSKAIKRTDRSERRGEDLALADRVEAAAQAGRDKVVEEEVFEELQKKRSEWTEVLAEVDELLKESENIED
tara:strand:+ start:633 stop:1229 length:597 start_codon:yes stop_codon:yes gene_type:complete